MWYHGSILNKFLNSLTLLDQGFFLTLQLTEGLVDFHKHKYLKFFFPVIYVSLYILVFIFLFLDLEIL